jgi:hypothetical protein
MNGRQEKRINERTEEMKKVKFKQSRGQMFE